METCLHSRGTALNARDLLTPVALFGFIGAQVLTKMGKTEDLESTCVLYMAILDTGARSDCVLNILLRLKAGPIRGAINCYLSA